MGGWLGRVEHRVARPDVTDVLHPQLRVLEEVSDLVIDLKRPVIVEEIHVEPLHRGERITSAHEWLRFAAVADRGNEVAGRVMTTSKARRPNRRHGRRRGRPARP